MLTRNERAKISVIKIAAGDVNENGTFILPTEFTNGDKIALDDFQKKHNKHLIQIEGDYPQEMTEVTLQNFRKLKKIPAFNENLTIHTVILEKCTDLESITGTFSRCLKELSLSNNKSLRTIESLPRSLESLDLMNCENLEDIPLLPDDLPWNINHINLNGCDRLVQTPELLESLRKLADVGCDVIYPDHFELSDTIIEMRNRLAQLGKQEDIENIEELLFYIVTEEPEDRSAKTELEDQYKDLFDRYVEPILFFLEKDKENQNSNALEWVKGIASIYLTGCVNQPVAGISEILSWISVAKERHLINKIDASKEILTLDTIKQFISDHLANPELENDDRIEPIIEVEAGNVLFRDVYNRLKSNKILGDSVYWKSVPEKVANELLVRSWIRKDDKISQAYKLVNEKVFMKPTANIAEEMCENFHQDIWSQLCFPKQISELKSQFSLKKELHTLVTEGKLTAEDVNEVDQDVENFIQAHINNQSIKDYYTLLSSKNIDELGDLAKNFEMQERTDILQLSRDLTIESLFGQKMDFIHYNCKKPSLHTDCIAEIEPAEKKFHGISLEEVQTNFQESLDRLLFDDAEKIIFSIPLPRAENEAEHHLGIYISRTAGVNNTKNIYHATCIETNNNNHEVPKEILDSLKESLAIEKDNIDHVSIKQDHIPQMSKEPNNLSVISYSLTELAKENINLEDISKPKKQKQPTSTIETREKGEQLAKKTRFI